MKEHILSQLSAECPWRGTLHWFDTIDSTNVRAREMAARGAPHGTVLIAGHQTGGRGRQGRSFSSPAGMGVYLSVILRPHCLPAELMHLTCAAAVAACDAVEAAAGFRPGIKWTNDLVAGGRKLGGILTELSLEAGTVQYAIIGIGINCRQQLSDFPPELQDIAASLSMVTGTAISCAEVAAGLIDALVRMDRGLLSDKAESMSRYRADCITPGREIVLLRAGQARYGTALRVDDDGGLTVRFTDGTTETVTSGEVSIRGMYGYV